MKLLPDLYQIAGPCRSHGFDATAYLLPVKDELYLIDCGTPLGYQQVIDNIQALGFDPKKITRIYGTHGHYDHISGAGLFQANYGAKLYLHQLDIKQVEAGDDVRTTAGLLYGQKAPAIHVDEIYQDGTSFETNGGAVTIIHTPGHSLGSCCFVLNHVCGVRLLIAGDTLHGGFSTQIGSDEALWHKSLTRLTNEHFDYFTFGHCNPQLLCDADERIAALAQSFANYYSPWFKDFFRDYRY